MTRAPRLPGACPVPSKIGLHDHVCIYPYALAVCPESRARARHMCFYTYVLVVQLYVDNRIETGPNPTLK